MIQKSGFPRFFRGLDTILLMQFFATILLTLWLQVANTSPIQSPPAAQEKKSADLPNDIPKWLTEGEHKDVPWKVHLEKPILTYQQREVVRAVAKVSGSALQEKSVHRNLMFIIRVADENGNWLPGGNFVTQRIDKAIQHSDVQMESEVLLRSGKYKIACIMYDSVTGEHNVSFLPIDIPAINNDPLRQLLQEIPAAEFVRGDIKGMDTLGEGKPSLPIHNRRPVHLELFVDMSTRERHPRPPGVLYTAAPADTTLPTAFRRIRDASYFLRILQSASVLSAMQPDNGCVTVTAFDAIKEKVILSPVAVDKVDWNKVREEELGPDKNTISVAALQGRKDVPSFVQKQFDALTSSPSCDAAAEKPVRVVVVLTHGLLFPGGSHKVKVEACDCSLFYLRQVETAMAIDDLKGIFSSLNPKVLEYSDAEGFRHKLADLIVETEKVTK